MLQSLISSKWPYRLVRSVLAIIFLYAGSSKLLNPGSLGVIIDAYGLVPGAWSMPIAILLPTLETVAAIGLFFDVRGALAVITGLLILFIAILGYGLWLGLDVDCGCFGPEDPEAEAFHGLRPALYRDLAMLAGIAYLYLWRLGRPGAPMRLGQILDAIWQSLKKEEN